MNKSKNIKIIENDIEKIWLMSKNKNIKLRLFLTSVTFYWIGFTAFCLLLISWLSKRF